MGKEIGEIKKIIEKLIIKELVEDSDGVLNITQKAKEYRKEHGMMNKEYKVELMQKSGNSDAEIDSLLKHFESKGVVQIKNECYMQIKKH